jgi:hypothetical protein
MKYIGNYKNIGLLNKIGIIVYGITALLCSIACIYLIVISNNESIKLIESKLFFIITGLIAFFYFIFLVLHFIFYTVIIDENIIIINGFLKKRIIDLKLFGKFTTIPRTDIIILYPYYKEIKKQYFLYWFNNDIELKNYMADKFHHYFYFPREREDNIVKNNKVQDLKYLVKKS